MPPSWNGLVARTIYVLLTGSAVFLFFVSLPTYYTQMQIICPTLPSCSFDGQVSRGTLPWLQAVHLPVSAYAASFLGLLTLNAPLSLLVGIVIVWRLWGKSNEFLGLLTSFVLILGGTLVNVTGSSTTFSAAIPFFLDIVGLLAITLYWPAIGMVLVTFPTGRFAPRWTWLVILLPIIQIFLYGLLQQGAPLLFAAERLIVWGSAFAVLAWRYRHLFTYAQQQQTKWLLYGVVPFYLAFLLYGALQSIPALNTSDSLYLIVGPVFNQLFSLILPLAIGIALLRYRLWDIDLIINRTLVYGALTLSVIGLYVLVVVGLGTLIQIQGNVLLSLLATGFIAVLFQPLRSRLQRGVNRLLYGERDEPYAVLARLGSRLEATLLPEKVLSTIVETVAQALKLPYVAIALVAEQQQFIDRENSTTTEIVIREKQEDMIVAASGAQIADPVRVPLVYHAETIGYLLLAARVGDAFGKAESRLLADLARQAGVAVYAVRLTAHLQRLTESLQQTREHLVTTREEERRRLRRDLHDGLGPTLASLTFKVDAARNVLTQDSQKADRLLEGVRQQAQDAIADIRRLVYNLRPPALDELGLLSALGEHVVLYHQQGLDVTFDAPPTLPPLLAAVEVAVYRIAQEALTNVARHAQARHCLLHLSIDSETLSLDISDDGRGIPVGHRIGVGLHAMHERANELGGSCSITRGTSGETMIQVRLPLAKAWDALPPSAQHARPEEQESTDALDVSLAQQEG